MLFLPWPFACKAKPWSWCLLFHAVTSNFGRGRIRWAMGQCRVGPSYCLRLSCCILEDHIELINEWTAVLAEWLGGVLNPEVLIGNLRMICVLKIQTNNFSLWSYSKISPEEHQQLFRLSVWKPLGSWNHCSVKVRTALVITHIWVYCSPNCYWSCDCLGAEKW